MQEVMDKAAEEREEIRQGLQQDKQNGERMLASILVAWLCSGLPMRETRSKRQKTGVYDFEWAEGLKKVTKCEIGSNTITCQHGLNRKH